MSGSAPGVGGEPALTAMERALRVMSELALKAEFKVGEVPHDPAHVHPPISLLACSQSPSSVPTHRFRAVQPHLGRLRGVVDDQDRAM